ncbi:MAG: HAD family hydrolase [Puniceicoccales bacterium]|jgi:putative hydrolase of the HAD superfamily|nr:HAD family hydrolase [Puniceicoccales bacterium]
MKPPPVSAPESVVVFDLDDTLFPERDYVESGFRAAGERVEQLFGREGFTSAALARFNNGERGKIFDAALGDLRIPASPAAVRELVRVYREHAPVLTLGDAEKTLLRELRASQRRLGIITDGYLEVQKRKVAALGIAPLVDVVIYSDTWGREAWKPSARPFRELENALRAPPAQCLYVADNPQKDFIGARTAGWRSVRLRLPNREHSGDVAAGDARPDAEFTSIADLSKHLLG